MTYRQLTREQRYQIYALKEAAHHRTESPPSSAFINRRSRASRRANGGRRASRPKQAQELAQARHLATYRPRISNRTWAKAAILPEGNGVLKDH